MRGSLRLYDFENTGFNFGNQQDFLITFSGVFSSLYVNIRFLANSIRMKDKMWYVVQAVSFFHSVGMAIVCKLWDFSMTMEIIKFTFAIFIIHLFENGFSKFMNLWNG